MCSSDLFMLALFLGHIYIGSVGMKGALGSMRTGYVDESWASGTARDRLDQARTLFALFPDLDRVYLEKRIRYESAGDHGLEILS